MVEDDDEPFLIKAENRSVGIERSTLQGAKTEDKEATLKEDTNNRLLKQRNNLRRRLQRRNDRNYDETKGQDKKENERNGLSGSIFNPAGEESKEFELSSPNRSSSRYLKSPSLAPPSAAADASSNSRRSPMPMIHHSNYIRRAPDERLKEKFKNKLRSVADGIPEVHFIGEVVEGIGFKDTFVSCKWYLEWGRAWSFLEGEESSQTQYAASDDGVLVWNHPIDVHFASASMQGWPRIVVQAWELDEFGRSILAGYGFVHLPTNPGDHDLEVHCWRPSGSIIEELQSFFLGTSTCLVNEDIVFGQAWEKRSQLTTVSSGVVKLQVTVILQFFKEQKVD